MYQHKIFPVVTFCKEELSVDVWIVPFFITESIINIISLPE